MKHARKKTPKQHEERTVKKSTTADYRKKYFFEDNSDVIRRQIANAGYKKRSLDSYIPADKLESKVRPNRPSSIDQTKKIDTAKIEQASKAYKRGSKPSEAKRTTKTSAAKSRSVAGKASSAKTSVQRATPAKRTTSSKKSAKGVSLPKRLIKKALPSVLIALFVAVIVLAGIGVGMYSAVSKELSEMNVQNLALNYSSFVYYNDANGNAVEDTQLHFEGERRIWVDSEDISINLKNAAVSIEDERFYKHSGVDFKRTLGAAVKWTFSKIGIGDASYGGSTITQQLVKNITNEKDKSVTRKVKEMMRAIALERQIDNKDEILTMYLNISYFSNQCNGVEAAANLYFSKKASEVSIAEAATIVGITQRPTYYDPLRNPENALAKRNTVLAKMKQQKYITKEEYEEAVNSPLGLSKSATTSKKVVYSYFVDAVINDVISDLITQKGYSSAFAEQQVFSGGLKIYTTMDKTVQDSMESVYENRTGFPKNSKPQSAMVVLDPSNGEVKGIVGGAGTKTEARGLNRATQSKRQPGSSIKPISVYAPAIELGKINSATVLRDEKISIGDWSPVNSYSGFKGDLLLSKCIEISANIPAVKALQLLGIENSYKYAKDKFHLDGVVPEDKSLASLGLGGLTNGVTVMDMAAAYAVFANGGIYNAPHTYTKVLDSTGKVLLEYTPEPQRVISEGTAFIVTDMLENVINGKSGTGRSAKLNNMTAYGKTGTTNDNKDKWFVGFTKYYVGAVWYGFDQPTNLRSVGITSNPSCTIWKNVMNKIHSGLSNEGFTPPDSVKKASICSATGKLASSGCPYTVTGYFIAGNVPSRFCKLSHPTAADTSDASPSPSASPSDASTASPSATDSNADTPSTSVPTETATPPAQTSGAGDDVISLD